MKAVIQHIVSNKDNIYTRDKIWERPGIYAPVDVEYQHYRLIITDTAAYIYVDGDMYPADFDFWVDQIFAEVYETIIVTFNNLKLDN